MKNEITEIMFQSCNLSIAMVRNINDNFVSISFEVSGAGEILTRFVMQKLDLKEREFIQDIIDEFVALQNSNKVVPPEIEIGLNSKPLAILVYQKL